MICIYNTFFRIEKKLYKFQIASINIKNIGGVCSTKYYVKIFNFQFKINIGSLPYKCNLRVGSILACQIIK